MAWKIMQGDVRDKLAETAGEKCSVCGYFASMLGVEGLWIAPFCLGVVNLNVSMNGEKFVRPGQSGGKKSKKVQIKGQENFQNSAR